MKKAIRRRNAKKVEFTTPQYYDPDPAEWSDEDPDLAQEQNYLAGEGQQQQNGLQQQEAPEDDYNRQSDVEPVEYRTDQRYDDKNGPSDVVATNGQSEADLSQSYADQNGTFGHRLTLHCVM